MNIDKTILDFFNDIGVLSIHLEDDREIQIPPATHLRVALMNFIDEENESRWTRSQESLL